MGISATQTMSGYHFEDREQQRNVMREIFGQQGESDDIPQKVIDRTSFNPSNCMLYSNAQLSILKASSQITANGSLKETLKYLKKHSFEKNIKKPVLGELWDMFSKEQYEDSDFTDFEIDYSAKNIFAAA